MMQIDDETLMAYADGALSPEEAERVADMLAEAPELADRVAALRAGRAAVAALPLPEVPKGLEAHLRALAAAQSAAPAAQLPQPEAAPPEGATNVTPLRRTARPALWQLPLTAAAALALGMVLGPLLMPAAEADGLPARVIAALDSLPAGASGDGVSLIASFADGSGTFCREYEDGSLTGIACRPDQDWQLRLAVASGSAEGYAPASSLEVIDAWMAQNEASAPLDPEAEALNLR